METVALSAKARSIEQTAQAIRREGLVPCVLYGNKVENLSLQCTYNDIHRAYVRAGESTIVELDAAGKKVPVLFHAIDVDPISSRIIHADFYAVDMKKEIEASVPIVFVGEAPAVKELGAVLVTPRDHVRVKCLPAKLPHNISVSLETLTEFHSTLTVANLPELDGVKILNDLTDVIAIAQEPRKEEVVEVAPETVVGAEGATAEGAAGETAEQDATDEKAVKKEGKKE